MKQQASFTLGIDATNLRQGGGLQHILALLQRFDPARDGFDKIMLWAPSATLNALPDAPWLMKSHHQVFERVFIRRGLWQWRELPLCGGKSRSGSDVHPGRFCTGEFSTGGGHVREPAAF